MPIFLGIAAPNGHGDHGLRTRILPLFYLSKMQADKDAAIEIRLAGLRPHLKKPATRDAKGNINLDLSGSKIRDLSILKGLPLARLNLDQTAIHDLTPLAGMPLTALHIYATMVTNLSPLRGMQLDTFAISSPVIDIAPLRGMPLTDLSLACGRVSNINGLSGAPLKRVWILSEKLTDIGPLKGCPVEQLEIQLSTSQKEHTGLACMNVNISNVNTDIYIYVLNLIRKFIHKLISASKGGYHIAKCTLWMTSA